MLLSSVSEPASRVASPRARHQPASQPSQAMRGSMASWLADSTHLSGNRSVAEVAHDSRAMRTVDEEMRSSDDFDTWEQGMSADDLRHVRVERDEEGGVCISCGVVLRELTSFSDFFVPDSQEHCTEPASGLYHTRLVALREADRIFSGRDASDDDMLESLSLGQYPARSRVRYRSQTAPEPGDSADVSSDMRPSHPLRREQSSPGPQRGLTPLDALRHAYAALADTDGMSQVDVEEIRQARSLARRIDQVLDDRIFSKITSSASRPRTPDG